MMLAALECRVACAMEALDRRYAGITERLNARLDTLEISLAALRSVMPPDILAAARAGRALGLSLDSLRQRQGTAIHARKVNLLFNHLRKQAWSVDRIARATGYTSRGVVANLRRFSNGNS